MQMLLPFNLTTALVEEAGNWDFSGVSRIVTMLMLKKSQLFSPLEQDKQLYLSWKIK